MPKRASGKQESDSKAVREGREGFAREVEPDAILKRKEDATTMEPVAAAPTNSIAAATIAPITRLPLKENTREKLLYKIACSGSPIGNEFFDEFPDRQELLELSLDISARLLITAIVNSEMPPTQRIASMRLVASLAGKAVPDPEEEARFKAAPPLAIPRGSKEEVSATLDKIRQLSGG